MRRGHRSDLHEKKKPSDSDEREVGWLDGASHMAERLHYYPHRFQQAGRSNEKLTMIVDICAKQVDIRWILYCMVKCSPALVV